MGPFSIYDKNNVEAAAKKSRVRLAPAYALVRLPPLCEASVNTPRRGR